MPGVPAEAWPGGQPGRRSPEPSALTIFLGGGLERDFKSPAIFALEPAVLDRDTCSDPQRATQPGGRAAHIPVRGRSPRRVEGRIPSSGNNPAFLEGSAAILLPVPPHDPRQVRDGCDLWTRLWDYRRFCETLGDQIL